MKKKTTGPSIYTILNRWLYDGSRESKLPIDVVNDKIISHMFILYYFRLSPYGLVISKLLNNWSLFSLDRNELLYFLKESVLLSGYKPPFIQMIKESKNKLSRMLKSKYPFLKLEEINMMVEMIDVDVDKNRYYEMFGLYTPTKKKTTKQQQKDFFNNTNHKTITLNDLAGDINV